MDRLVEELESMETAINTLQLQVTKYFSTGDGNILNIQEEIQIRICIRPSRKTWIRI